MGRLILVTGGARSGKSTFAQRLAQQSGRPVAYLATLKPLDEEMGERVRRHQMMRPTEWKTFEESLEVPSALRKLDGFDGVVILECLTLLVTNLLMQGIDSGDDDASLEDFILASIDELIETAIAASFSLIVVTNEVGLGIVPDSRLGRLFRDIAGLANQRVASRASSVYLVISGIPVTLKDFDTAINGGL